jgi:hypothetical protein
MEMIFQIKPRSKVLWVDIRDVLKGHN